MRGFGGALIAIALVLYLGLPFLLFTNALIAYGVLVSVDPTVMPLSCAEDGTGDCMVIMARMAATTSFAAIFLPALDFIILAAFGRELAHLFGSEVDLTRLSRLV